jgi:hypothetical protein
MSSKRALLDRPVWTAPRVSVLGNVDEITQQPACKTVGNNDALTGGPSSPPCS